MARFDLALPVILEHEGGFVNNIHDPGGATKYGISLRFLQGLGSAGDVNRDGKVDAADVKALTPEKAADFYRERFWVPGGFDAIIDQTVATKMFDASVNMGLLRARTLACRAAGLAVVGDPTEAINRMDAQRFLANMSARMRAFYDGLIHDKPALATFRNGWLKRAAWPEVA